MKETKPRRHSSTRLLILLFAFVIGISFVSDLMLTRSSAFWKFCRKRADTRQTRPLKIEAILRSRSPENVRIVFTGSSIVGSNISKKMIANRLGIPAYQVVKIALPGGTDLEWAMIYPRLIRLRPKLVVHLSTVWSLFDRLEWGTVRFYDPAAAYALLNWSELLKDFKHHASGTLGALHVVIRHRDSLRRILFEQPVPDSRKKAPDNQKTPGGTDARRIKLKRIRARSEINDFRCPSIQTRAIDLMAKTLIEHNIGFIAVSAPISNRWGRRPDLRNKMNECLSSRAKTQGYGFVPNSDPKRFESTDFRDRFHMNSKGRKKFTADLIDHIKPLFAANPGG